MKANPEELKGLVLAGGIMVSNSSEYKRSYNRESKRLGPIVRNRDKVGRNSPCPCGSGKKAKNCHPNLTQ